MMGIYWNKFQDGIQRAFRRLSLLKKRSAVAVSGEQLLQQCYDRLQQHLRSRYISTAEGVLRDCPELVAEQPFVTVQGDFDGLQNQNLPNSLFDAGCSQGQPA